MNRSVPLKPQEITNKITENLTCAICLCVPLTPVLTPCQHLFCQECICQAPARVNGCPTCRANVHTFTPLDRKGLLYRIWSEIEVRCGNHEEGCNWTGSVGSAETHMRSCKAMNSKANNRALNDLKDQCAALKASNQMLQRSMERLGNELARVCLENRELTGANSELVRTNQRLSEQLKPIGTTHVLVPGLCVGSNYGFNRFSIVKLSQLIARYDDVPNNMDVNRIFNCVKSCYDDLVRNYHDNPPNYYVNVRMLLSICAASSWFTPNQINRINIWIHQQRWN